MVIDQPLIVNGYWTFIPGQLLIRHRHRSSFVVGPPLIHHWHHPRSSFPRRRESIIGDGVRNAMSVVDGQWSAVDSYWVNGYWKFHLGLPLIHQWYHPRSSFILWTAVNPSPAPSPLVVPAQAGIHHWRWRSKWKCQQFAVIVAISAFHPAMLQTHPPVPEK